MYALMHTMAGRRATTREVVVALFIFRASAEEALAERGSTYEIVELTEYAEARIREALRDEEELALTLETGLSRRTRGTK